MNHKQLFRHSSHIMTLDNVKHPFLLSVNSWTSLPVVLSIWSHNSSGALRKVGARRCMSWVSKMMASLLGWQQKNCWNRCRHCSAWPTDLVPRRGFCGSVTLATGGRSWRCLCGACRSSPKWVPSLAIVLQQLMTSSWRSLSTLILSSEDVPTYFSVLSTVMGHLQSVAISHRTFQVSTYSGLRP